MYKFKYLKIILAIGVLAAKLTATTTGSIMQVDTGFTDTVTGVISGTGYPSKTGGGTLTFGNAANTFSGAQIELAAGTLSWTATNNITSAVGADSYIGHTRSFRWVTGASAPVLQLGGNIGTNTSALGTLDAVSLATVAGGGFTWYPTGFTSPGGLAVNAAATVDLNIGNVALPTGAGNYYLNGTLITDNTVTTGTGDTRVYSAGVLDTFNSSGVLSAAVASGVVTIHHGGTLRFPGATGNWGQAITLTP